ncbi:MAG: enoyl-CoA hydratase-related protein, partial [Rhodospirillales bacterium]
MNTITEFELQTIKTEKSGPHVLVVTLNRPEVSNAFNTLMGRELLGIWSALYREPSQCRAIILTGSGERAFCGGADLKERNGMSDAE